MTPAIMERPLNYRGAIFLFTDRYGPPGMNTAPMCFTVTSASSRDMKLSGFTDFAHPIGARRLQSGDFFFPLVRGAGIVKRFRGGFAFAVTKTTLGQALVMFRFIL